MVRSKMRAQALKKLIGGKNMSPEKSEEKSPDIESQADANGDVHSIGRQEAACGTSEKGVVNITEVGALSTPPTQPIDAMEEELVKSPECIPPSEPGTVEPVEVTMVAKSAFSEDPPQDMPDRIAELVSSLTAHQAREKLAEVMRDEAEHQRIAQCVVPPGFDEGEFWELIVLAEDERDHALQTLPQVQSELQVQGARLVDSVEQCREAQCELEGTRRALAAAQSGVSTDPHTLQDLKRLCFNVNKDLAMSQRFQKEVSEECRILKGKLEKGNAASSKDETVGERKVKQIEGVMAKMNQQQQSVTKELTKFRRRISAQNKTFDNCKTLVGDLEMSLGKNNTANNTEAKRIFAEMMSRLSKAREVDLRDLPF